MDEARESAAETIWRAWQRGEPLEALPEACRPATESEGYAAQAALEALADSPVVGWKIAATSAAGQAHIAVPGPIAGRIFASRLHRAPASISMRGNRMAVAEAEFAFVLAEDLPDQGAPYATEEVLAAVGALHPAIELPNSRFRDFTAVGAPSLAADNACAHELVLGPAADEGWREVDLAAHPVELWINRARVVAGSGADVLGDPRAALTWLVNSPPARSRGVRAGDVVTTGVCGRPAPVGAGDLLSARFGALGSLEVRLV